MAFIKPRTLPQGGRSFAGNVRQTQERSGRSRREFITGTYDYWYPDDEKAQWFAICPFQEWSYDEYDGKLDKVVKTEGQFYFAFWQHLVVQHFGGGKKKIDRFACSAGVTFDKPCWGCAIYNAFWDEQRKIEKDTGVKPEGKSPVSRSPTYAMACVVLEEMAKIPSLDDKGKQKLNKANEPIYREKPLVLMDTREERDKWRAQGATTFAGKRHWSMGKDMRDQLKALDEILECHCANCAAELTCSALACPECASKYAAQDDGDPLKGQKLREEKDEVYQCECGYKGPLTPILDCACGHPEQGGLQYFAVRLVTEKTGENKRVLRHTGIRPLQYYVDKYPQVEEMLNKPLEVDKINAPLDLPLQKFRIPERLREGLTPEPRKRKPKGDSEGTTDHAVPYTLGSAQDDTDNDYYRDNDNAAA